MHPHPLKYKVIFSRGSVTYLGHLGHHSVPNLLISEIRPLHSCQELCLCSIIYLCLACNKNEFHDFLFLMKVRESPLMVEIECQLHWINRLILMNCANEVVEVSDRIYLKSKALSHASGIYWDAGMY